MQSENTSYRLLLVEDSRGDAMVAQALIASAGRLSHMQFDVDHVISFEAAIEQLSRADATYDLALLDLGLPDSEGVDSVVRLAARFPSLAVVVLTALDDVDAGLDAVASGAQEFLPKGKVRPDELARVLRHAILRKRMEQTVRESEAEHRALFELNPHPIWVFDRRTLRFLAANDAAIREYGWTQDQLSGMRVTDIRPPEDVPLLLSFLNGDVEVDNERVWRQRTRDGEELMVQLSAHRLEFYGLPACLVMARNVTETARLADALAVSEQRFRALFERSSELLFEHGLDGRVSEMNPAAASRLGYDVDVVKQRPLQQLMPASQAAALAAYLDCLRERGEFAGELIVVGRDQQQRQWQVSSRRYDEPGRTARVMVQAVEAGDTPAA